MQWLIDIIAETVIERMGIPPCFVDRGDPAPPDLIVLPATMDNTWYNWRITHIVPAGATAVLIRTFGAALLVAADFRQRTLGNANIQNISHLYSQVAGVNVSANAIVAVGADRTVQYWAPLGGYSVVMLTVGGWWM